jgi:hypothetical protein
MIKAMAIARAMIQTPLNSPKSFLRIGPYYLSKKMTMADGGAASSSPLLRVCSHYPIRSYDAPRRNALAMAKAGNDAVDASRKF